MTFHHEFLRGLVAAGARVTAATLGLATSAFADPVKFARTPHVANDGRIAFAYHGDLWVVDSDGRHPRRLTDHEAEDRGPRFSPDGKWIAFTSNRFGNDDVFVIPSTGGDARAVTAHSTGDTLLYWTPNGERLLIATSRSANPWGSPLYTVGLDGSRPIPLSMDRGAAGMIRQDGQMIAFNRIGFRYWRKGYRGNNNTDVYVMPVAGGPIRKLTDLDLHDFRNHTQDAFPMWATDGNLWFLSERGGLFNLWSIAPDGSDLQQRTQHAADGVQSPSISPDGSTIVYENEFELWRLRVPDGQPEKIALDLDFDVKANLVEYREFEEFDGFAPSADGEEVAIDVHGEIFRLPVEPEYGEKAQVTASPWRDRGAVYSPDGKVLAYVSDESGDEEIWFHDLERGANRKITAQESIKDGLVFSSDSGHLVFSGANRLYLVEVESGVIEEIAYNENFGFQVAGFCGDDRYLLYSRSDADLDSEVYLFSLAEREEYNLSQHPASDRAAFLSGDGSTLVFTSDRDGTNHLYSVSLTKRTADPDDPLVRAAERDANKDKDKGGRDGEGGRGQENGGDFAPDADRAEPESSAPSEEQQSETSAAEEAPPEPLALDLDGIDRRPRQLTRGEDGVGRVFGSADGQTIYFTTGGGGRFFGGRFFGGGGGTTKLESMDLLGRDRKEVGEVSARGLTPTADRSHVFFQDGDALKRMPLKGGKSVTVPVSVRVKIDQRAEWVQIFEESWRVMKYRFYDEDMHGFDWDAIKARYQPLLAHVGQNQDLYDLCNEMIGELNASHTGVSGPPSRAMESQYSTPHLGFELEAEGQHYRVSHVYRDGPSDQEWLDLDVGDYVLALDGQTIRAGDEEAAILNHSLNDYVAVQVASPAENPAPGAPPHGEVRVLRIRKIGSVRNLQYEQWVEQNRELVDELSGGKIGYVHIRSMNRTSLARFETEIDRYWNKNGMIIDIRYNGGGNIDQELIDILERRPYEYWNFRWGGRAFGRRPRQAIAGPKVMLINWRSASDSEVTPQAFRDLELGRIVGNPTYGAVIATGSYGLINGARIRTPGSLVVTYDPSQPHNYGINLENFGVAPDVWVENTPQDELDGNDRELKTAVAEALKMLEEGDWQYGEDD